MKYPVAKPIITSKEKKYVMDCLDSGWISSNGKYIEKFEEMFSDYCNTKYAIACSNGTTALHLALLACDIKKGDEVIIPSLTFVATANAVTYCNATPIPVDSCNETWNIDPRLIEEKINKKTKAIIVVHLYGHPVDMDPITKLAKKYNLKIIEDAAQAIGAEYKGRKIGSLGDIATFSLFGNKIITTGEGGMITTSNEEFDKKIRLLRAQGMDSKIRYWHPVVGYNYRMTNIQAAIGCAQLENINSYIESRIKISKAYYEELKDIENITLSPNQKQVKNVFWMFSIVLDSKDLKRDIVCKKLEEYQIETRPFFYPMHVLPSYNNELNLPISEFLSKQGINLPTYSELNSEDITYICNALKSIIKEG